MKVRKLIEFLQDLPQDAHVHLDDAEYPEVDGCFIPDPEEYADIEAADKPPLDVVLLEVTYPKEKE
jgi:hypothetical protein